MTRRTDDVHRNQCAGEELSTVLDQTAQFHDDSALPLRPLSKPAPRPPGGGLESPQIATAATHRHDACNDQSDWTERAWAGDEGEELPGFARRTRQRREKKFYRP